MRDSVPPSLVLSSHVASAAGIGNLFAGNLKRKFRWREGNQTMWSLPPGDSVLHVLSLIAIAAQGMTAALAAGRRSMDWLGVCFLGCITALGGGTLRDLFLGHYPLVWVANPVYLALAGGAAFLTILTARLVHRLKVAFIVLDAIGLVVFTMAGCDVAWQMGASLPIVIVSGMVTGCAGGV